MLPFGVQIKGVIVGVLLALFVWPWVSGMLSAKRTAE